MFFTCFSENSARNDDVDFCSLYDLEVCLSGFIREFYDDILSLPDCEIIEMMRGYLSCINMFQAPERVCWINEVLSGELPYIRAFLLKYKDDNSRMGDEFWATTLKVQVLKECAQRSAAFNNHIEYFMVNGNE